MRTCLPGLELETESDYNLYAKQLATLGYGIPLWQPAPLSDYKRVKIADVGYIRTGQFYRLFNACLPSDDPAQCRGVPANFQPLQLDEVASEQKQLRMPGVLHTRDIRVEGVDFDLAANPSWVENGQTVRFEASSGKGAILVTKDVTLREDAVQVGFMESYMAENYETWLDMANRKLGRGIRLEDLILVTGYDLTTQSAMTVFDEGGIDVSITFKATRPNVQSSPFSTWGEWHTACPAAVFKNFGSSVLSKDIQLATPCQEPLPSLYSMNHPDFNQCLFLRGFHIRRIPPSRGSLIASSPTIIGRDEHDGGSDSRCHLLDQIDVVDSISEVKCEVTVAVEAIADKTPFADSLESHFERILEANGVEVQKVIVHDNDIPIPRQVASDAVRAEIFQPQSSSPEITLIPSEVPGMNPQKPEELLNALEPGRMSDIPELIGLLGRSVPEGVPDRLESDRPQDCSEPEGLSCRCKPEGQLNYHEPEASTLVVTPDCEFVPHPNTNPANWTFPSVPAKLRRVSAYLQRAQELKVKNPVISYWCTYYAVKKSLTSIAQNEETQLFLEQVISILEGMKASLGENDAVLHDGTSAKYVANFASRVFKNADSEDKKQKANRSTAKKFLASATFFELLHLFKQPIEIDIEEKITYAKWKAAHIVKSCSDSRAPLTGIMKTPPYLASSGCLATPATLEALDLAHDTMSAWSPGPSIAVSLAPSPAIPGLGSLESTPVPRAEALPYILPDPVISLRENGVAPSTPNSSSASPPEVLERGEVCPVEHRWKTEHDPDRVHELVWNLDGEQSVVEPGESEEQHYGPGKPEELDKVEPQEAKGEVDIPEVQSDMHPKEPDEEGDLESTETEMHCARQPAETGVQNAMPPKEPEAGGDVEFKETEVQGDMSPKLPEVQGDMSPQGLEAQADLEPKEHRGQEEFSVWSALGIQFANDEASGTNADAVSMAEMDLSGTMPPVTRVKRVHFSPSVVGGLSSTSSSVAASSPPASPERYAPSLPPVPEAAYSSDSDREGDHCNPVIACPWGDPTLIPLPESVAASEFSDSESGDSEGWAHGIPPTITKVSSPTSTPSSDVGPPKVVSLELKVPSPRFHPQFFSRFSPRPNVPPALHPTPLLFPHALEPCTDDIKPSPPPPSDNSISPELDESLVTQAQRHCRFAISALDAENAQVARNEIRAALAMLS